MYDVVANDGTVFTFLTNKNAPRYKVVQTDLNKPNLWTDIVGESEDVLVSAFAVNTSQMILKYLRDVKNVVQIRDLETGSLLHTLPIEIGTVYGISARREHDTIFIGFTSFLTPSIIYRCDLKSEALDMKIFRQIVVHGFDPTQFYVDQVLNVIEV